MSETRTILNSHGDAVGELTLPDGTSEDVWTSLLTGYLTVYTPPDSATQVISKLQLYRQFGDSIILSFAAGNVLTGIVPSGKTRAVADFCWKLQTYLAAGGLYAALEEFGDRISDPIIAIDLTNPLYPYVTPTKLTTYRDQVKVYLGIP